MSKTCPSCLGKGSILTNAGTGLLRPCFNAKFHTLSGTSPKPRPRMGQSQDKQHNTAMSEPENNNETPPAAEAPESAPVPTPETETQEIAKEGEPAEATAE